MSDTTPSELELLKERADQMGISYHPNIGLDKLREKVNAVLAPEPKEEDAPAGAESEREKLIKEASKLKRINITCMNPAKRDWPGEIFTCGNAVVGTFRKFVPFGTENGYHVPNIIYNMLKERKFQQFRNEKSKNGVNVRVGYMVAEFAIQDLPPLTKEELDQLRKDQAARGE